MTHYTVVSRRNCTDSWKPSPCFYTLKEAQRILLNYSRGSSMQFDIMKCVSVLHSCWKEEKCAKPEIIGEEKCGTT
jgi:hypothetical protein